MPLTLNEIVKDYIDNMLQDLCEEDNFNRQDVKDEAIKILQGGE